MDLEQLMTNIVDSFEDGVNEFPSIQLTESLDEKFKKQESEIDGVEFEYVWQNYDQFDSYHGELAVPFGDGRKCLVWSFYG
ncbi:hypothetical protein VCSRO110_0703 [Vibrio cholerae]|nr:hypothetical protein VCSRO110_0703 [Vibrio cholerae]